jgi:glycosyltransferase involved in cell wall biosynthesis
MTGPAANAVYIVALRTDVASTEPSLPVSARAPIVALLPWGDVFHDFLDGLGVTLEEFRDEFIGSWMFGFVAALSTAGVRTLLVCPTTHVRDPSRVVHRPTGAELLFLPAPRGFASLRRGALEGRLDGRRDPRSLARAAASHLAPYAATPPLALARHLRRQRCDAILCQEYEDPRFDTCVAVGRAVRIPVFATFQGADYQLSKLERPLRPLALRACAGLVIGPASEAARVRRRYGVAPDKIARIVNPVDLAVWRPVDGTPVRAELGIPESASVVAWHGQVQIRRKGLDVLLDAWARVVAARPRRELRLLLVGSGEDSVRLRELVAGRGDLRVQLVEEWVESRDRLCALLSAADIYVFPSRHEGLPVSPLEALACGLPVVGADAQGVSDVIGDCGTVVPAGDTTALADALGTLLDDDERRSELGHRARMRAEERFGLEAVGAQLRAFLLEGRRP